MFFSYHIPTIHPGLNKEVDINTYRVVVEDGYVEHLTETTKESAYDGVWLWHHPTLAINWYGPGLRYWCGLFFHCWSIFN